jgi:glycosyltransferase involved in cell wall biosynthesis
MTLPPQLHIITPEYSPDRGGVADYSALVANGLREAGYSVHVWCPASRPREDLKQEWVHREPQGFGVRGLKRIGKSLNRFAKPRKLLVQWVPHGYGWRAMNVAFCFWVLMRALRGDSIEIMLHEAFLAFRKDSWRQSFAAAVQRFMTVILLASTRQVWISSPSWEAKIRPYCLKRNIRFTWLPVPSTIPVVATADSVVEIRGRYAPGSELLLGHFGTYGRLTTDMLEEIVPAVLSGNQNCKLLLIGANSDSYRKTFASRFPELASRVFATGEADAKSVSRSLMACDVLIQPYPEGVTARRTTCLAALAHGKPVVTTLGEMTEDFWQTTPQPLAFGGTCVEAVEVATRLLNDQAELQNLGERAKKYYRENFALEHVIQLLQFEISPANEC